LANVKIPIGIVNFSKSLTHDENQRQQHKVPVPWCQHYLLGEMDGKGTNFKIYLKCQTQNTKETQKTEAKLKRNSALSARKNLQRRKSITRRKSGFQDFN
jgi:hypothetical protein